MRSRHELDYGSQYHQNNHHTAQGDMSRVLTPYHMNGENGSAAIDFNAYGIREGGLRAEGDCEYGQPQQGGRDRQQHSRYGLKRATRI